MKVPEFIEKIRSDWMTEGETDYENIPKLGKIIESQRKALEEISAKGPRRVKTLAVVEEIARRELEREVEGR